jgi:hypothetical protein
MADTKQERREEETAFFEAFCHAKPDLQLVDFIHRDKPDFVGIRGEKRIGVEVTRYSPARRPGAPSDDEQGGLQHWAMSLAREKYEDAGGAPIDVQAVFDRNHPLTKKTARQLSEEIAHFLTGESRALIMYERSTFDDVVGITYLRGLVSIRAIRVPTEAHAAWLPVQMGWVRHAESEDIVHAAREKEKRVTEYRHVCDELWLLIGFPVSGGEIHVKIPIEPVDFAVPSAFQRIFCVLPAGPSCVEVPVTPLR